MSPVTQAHNIGPNLWLIHLSLALIAVTATQLPPPYTTRHVTPLLRNLCL